MTSPGVPAKVLAANVISEYHLLKGDRFLWTSNIRDLIVADWKKHFIAYRRWANNAQATLQKLHDEGLTEIAEVIAGEMLAAERLVKAGKFTINVATGFGFETFSITGSDEMDHFVPDESTAPQTDLQMSAEAKEGSSETDVLGVYHGLPVYQPSSQDYQSQRGCIPHMMSLIKPVQVVWSEIQEHMELPSITLSEAMRQRVWISCTPCGALFTLVCDCHPIMLPTTRLGSAVEAYELVPRHFRSNPFEDRYAEVHFFKVHNWTFPNVQAMIQEQGQIITDSDEMLDGNMLGAYNLSVKNREQQLSSRWERLREDYRPTRPQRTYSRSQITHICEANGTVQASELPPPESAFRFPWPEARGQEDSQAPDWVVICNHPECISPYFAHHPLQKQRAVDHFASHDLQLRDDSEIMGLFGFRVVYETKGTQLQQVSTRTKATDIKEYYHKYNIETLLQECRSRGIKVPAAVQHRKAVLIKKLKQDDGQPVYEDKTWSMERLIEECRNSGLSTSRNRKGLIEQLRWRDNRQRQRQDNTEDMIEVSSEADIMTLPIRGKEGLIELNEGGGLNSMKGEK